MVLEFLVGVVAIIGIAVAIIFLPRRQVRHLKANSLDRAKAEDEARKTIVQVLTGFALVGSLWFTWDQIRETKSVDALKTELGRILKEKYHINPSTDCITCHR